MSTTFIARNSVNGPERLINIRDQEYGFFELNDGSVLVCTHVDPDCYQELHRRLSKETARALWTLLARQALDAAAEEAAYERHLEERCVPPELATEID